jgi:hypothetical protein
MFLLEWLLTRRSDLVASSLLFALRRWVWRGGRGVWLRAAAWRAFWSWLHGAARAWLSSVGCVFVFKCLMVDDLFLCLSRHDGVLPSVPSLSIFHAEFYSGCFPLAFRVAALHCGVARRAWCVAAGGGMAGVLVLVASYSWCVA